MLFNRFGSLVCHQNPERTLDRLLPLCARCTGIYTGFLIGLLYQVLTEKRKVSGLPPLTVSVISGLLILGILIEGWGEKLQLWQLPNQKRLLTGLLAGSSVSLILLPLFNYFLRKKSEPSILTGGYYFGLLVLLSFFFGLSYWPGSTVIFLSLSLTGILAIYFLANMIFAMMALNWRERKINGKGVILLLGFVLALFTAEILVLNSVHEKP